MENMKTKLLEAYEASRKFPEGALVVEMERIFRSSQPDFDLKATGEATFAGLLRRFPEIFRLQKDEEIPPREYVFYQESDDEDEIEEERAQIRFEEPEQDKRRIRTGILSKLPIDSGYGFIRENDPPEDLTGGRRLFLPRSIDELDLRYAAILQASGQTNIELAYTLVPSSNARNRTDIADRVRCVDITPDMRKRMSLKMFDWCYIPDRVAMLESLATEFARPEQWNFPGEEKPYQILWNYLWHTFTKLQMEKLDKLEELYRSGVKGENFDTISGVGIGYSRDYSLAAFNTGLVNDSYEPIIAVFDANDPGQFQPYKFRGFCIPGEKNLGNLVQTEIIGELNRAKYFSETSDCVYLDPEMGVQGNWNHIIHDGVRSGRFPEGFLQDNCARALRELGLDGARLDDRDLERLADYIEDEPGKKTFLNLKGRLESALNLALKRVAWNFRTAIPVWYPRAQKLDLLLPLALMDDHTPDAALVVEQIRQVDGKGRSSLKYTAHTIFTLDMAYSNSRLVCMPASDWLLPQNIPAPRRMGYSEGN